MNQTSKYPPAQERREALSARERELEAARDREFEVIDGDRERIRDAFDRAVTTADNAYAQELAALQASLESMFLSKRDRRSQLDEGTARLQLVCDTAKRKAAAERKANARGDISVRDDGSVILFASRQQRVAQKCTDATSEAVTAARLVDAAVNRQLAGEWYAAIGVLLTNGVWVPGGGWFQVERARRTLGERIGRLFWEFDRRAKQELGAELSPHVLAFAVCDRIIAERPDAVHVFGPAFGSTWIWSEAVGQSMKAFPQFLENGVGAITAAFATLVEQLEAMANKPTTPSPQAARWYAVMREVATRGMLAETISALTKQDALEQQREFEATYVPPERERLSRHGEVTVEGRLFS